MSAIRTLAARWWTPLLGIWLVLTALAMLSILTLPAVPMGIFTLVVGAFALLAS
jgi:hypothetical protein